MCLQKGTHHIIGKQKLKLESGRGSQSSHEIKVNTGYRRAFLMTPCSVISKIQTVGTFYRKRDQASWATNLKKKEKKKSQKKKKQKREALTIFDVWTMLFPIQTQTVKETVMSREQEMGEVIGCVIITGNCEHYVGVIVVLWLFKTKRASMRNTF